LKLLLDKNVVGDNITRVAKEKTAKLEKYHRFLRDKRQADRIKAAIALSKGYGFAIILGEMVSK